MTTTSRKKPSRNPTKATHTAGPWGIAKSHIKDVIAIRTDGQDDGQCVAQALRDIGEQGEDEANAHLIAAAPELHDALEDLLGDRPSVQGGICIHCGRDFRDEGPMEGNCPSEDCPSTIARAVLVRASGGQP